MSTSPQRLQPVPKFHLYKPDIALISGIAWDHINVFKTFESYVDQFRIFIDAIEPGGKLVYCTGGCGGTQRLSEATGGDGATDPLRRTAAPHRGRRDHSGDRTGRSCRCRSSDEHNLQNLEGARHVCHLLGIGDAEFYAAIASVPRCGEALGETGRGNGSAWSSRISRIHRASFEGNGAGRARAVPGPAIGGLHGTAHVTAA